MKKSYIKPIVLLEQIDNNILTINSYPTCECTAHRGNHSKCGKGCHNSQAIGHQDIDNIQFELEYEY